MTHLILVRHGESRWNIANKFTGWVDVPLSEVGIHEAMITAERLKNLTLDHAFTSRLARAMETLLLILSEQKRTAIVLHESKKMKEWSNNRGTPAKNEIPVIDDWRLNERYYGDLQGIDKDYARKKWGKEKVHVWRRSYDIAPPKGESLKDVYKRTIPYFEKEIMPLVRKKKNVIVAAHGNSLRAIIKYIDNISDEDIPNLELQTGKPVIYKWFRGKLVHDEAGGHRFDRPTEWKHKAKHRQGYKVKRKKK